MKAQTIRTLHEMITEDFITEEGAKELIDRLGKYCVWG